MSRQGRARGLWWRRGLIWGVIALLWVFSGLRLALPERVLAQDGTNHVDLINLNTSIDTFTAGYVQRALDIAQNDGASAFIIVLDTPGGESDAMDTIIKTLLSSPIPSVVYVAPSGARAASAGTFITYAANVAAMAPGTRIGAAHPVGLGGTDITSTEGTKITNDAIAEIQSLAEQRGRNADWAAKAVSESVSITEKQALDLHVIDLIAQDNQDLLNQLDGRKVQQNGRELTFRTRGASITSIPMTPIEEFLHILLDPNIAAILFSIGSLAILVELYNPGATVPAVVGVICITLALVALYNLPTNWAALILIVAAIIMFVLDVKLTSIVLTIGGIIAFILGSLFLFRPFTTPQPTFTPVYVSPFVIAGLTLLMTFFFLFVIRAAVRSRLAPVVTGITPFLDSYGVATSDFALVKASLCVRRWALPPVRYQSPCCPLHSRAWSRLDAH